MRGLFGSSVSRKANWLISWITCSMGWSTSSARASSSIFVDVHQVACSIFDKFGCRLCHLHFCIPFRIAGIFLQKLMDLEDFSWSKTELALYLGAIG